jgi:formate C-acetyltransferase
MAATTPILSPQELRIEQGQGTGLATEEAGRSRARIHRMLEGLRDQPIRLSLERARLLTRSFRETEGQPVVTRWGKALAHVLDHHPIHIGDDDLIVGSAGPPGRYAILYPELEERFFAEDLRPSTPGERVLVTERDVEIVNQELRPYWQGRQYHTAFRERSARRDPEVRGALLRPHALAGLEPPARARMAELARVAEEARRDRT